MTSSTRNKTPRKMQNFAVIEDVDIADKHYIHRSQLLERSDEVLQVLMNLIQHKDGKVAIQAVKLYYERTFGKLPEPPKDVNIKQDVVHSFAGLAKQVNEVEKRRREIESELSALECEVIDDSESED